MSDLKFPSKDEVLALRESGKVALSSQASRMIAGLITLIFIFRSNMKTTLEGMFSADLENISSSLSALTFEVVSWVVVYLVAFSAICLLQSNFYFRPGRFFQVRGLWSRIRFLNTTVLFTGMFLGIASLSILLFGAGFYLSLLETLNSPTLRSNELLDTSLSLGRTVSIVLMGILALAAIFAFLLAKFVFLYQNRSPSRRY